MGVFDRNEDPGRNTSPFTGRLILGILIGLIALFTYFSNSQENPVTHQVQHISLTPDQEIRLGLESAPSMARQMGGEIPSTDPRTIEVSKIGQFIVSKTEAEKSPWKFKFHLLADPQTINAFALPGGQIFITLGLYEKLQTEGQLAGVLSHEVGHVIERHSAQQLAKAELGQMLVFGVGVGASSNQQSTLYDPAMIAAVANQMIQLHYSRHDESQADIWGLKLMSEIGFDPRAMIDVMEILKAAAGKRGGQIEMFQTHPNPDLRIEQINAYLKEHPPQPGLTQGENLKHSYR